MNANQLTQRWKFGIHLVRRKKIRGMLPSSSDSSGSEDSERGRGQKRSSNKEALDDKVVEKSPKGRFYRVCKHLR